jgi:hypothetical protein
MSDTLGEPAPCAQRRPAFIRGKNKRSRWIDSWKKTPKTKRTTASGIALIKLKRQFFRLAKKISGAKAQYRHISLMKRGHCSYIVKKTAPSSIIFGLFLSVSCGMAQVPATTKQLIVAVAPDWASHRASLTCYERDVASKPWQPAFKISWPVLLGSKGLAWGRGAFISPKSKADEKKERDGKAPAGIFALGSIYGNEKAPPRGTKWPYVQVGENDAWIDDPKLPQYNEHVRIDPRSVPPWFESQRMRLGDNAYKWLLEIRHNTNPAVPGYGSAIFFHVRRGPDSPTAGCTTMALENLESMIRWLRPKENPHYVLLPSAEYEKMRESWGLP